LQRIAGLGRIDHLAVHAQRALHRDDLIVLHRLILGHVRSFHENKTRSKAGSQWRGWDLDPRPRAYESPALPLSYLAGTANITMPAIICQRWPKKRGIRAAP